ncbi:hypothetical protein F4802DRAFT_44004 [Xylaria palmicola]|nr:hypothetical protein F4802DRAFT_44004 [Xylaria palmicola]
MDYVVGRLGEAIPSTLWNVVRWVTFFFKLVSLAFAVPIAGIIVFDLCVWFWRLYRPSQPPDSPRSDRLRKDYAQRPSPASSGTSTIAVEFEPKPQAAQRRVAYGTVSDD